MNIRLQVAILITAFFAVFCSETADEHGDAAAGGKGRSDPSSGGIAGNVVGESGTPETGGTNGASGTQASSGSGDGNTGNVCGDDQTGCYPICEGGVCECHCESMGGAGGSGESGSATAGTGGTGEGGSSGSAAAGDGGSAGTAGETTETPGVEPDDPMYDRYEGTALDNDCESDDDCMTSGCSREVCAAESVVTPCEVIEAPGGQCGCVAKQCIWHESGGSAGTAGETTETPSVEPDDPLYDRYEGTALDNDCESDDDCMTSGCSGEVCAAETAITSCEVIEAPGGQCGCVDKQCIWHESGAPLAADQCRDDRGCVVYSDYCGGCNCLALPEGDSPPECNGDIVNCFADPCMNRSAGCVDGRCVLE